jgi:putative ABC transport system permease protein
MLGQALRGALFGIEPADSVTFAGAILVLLFTALIACLAPAWRAVRINPIHALRIE